jgi:hypothetical protein
MPSLKKNLLYRHKKNKSGVDVIPVEDREVSVEIYKQYEEVKDVEKV